MRLDDGRIDPLPRPVSLKNASIDVIRAWAPAAELSPPGRRHPQGHGRAHAGAGAPASRARASRRSPAWIVFPKWRAGAAAELAPVPQARAHLRLAENCL